LLGRGPLAGLTSRKPKFVVGVMNVVSVINEQSDLKGVMEDKIRGRKWWGGLEGGSGGMD